MEKKSEEQIWSSPNSYDYAPWLTSGVFARAERIFLTRTIAYQLFGTNFSLSSRRRQKRALLILCNYQQYLKIILYSHLKEHEYFLPKIM